VSAASQFDYSLVRCWFGNRRANSIVVQQRGRVSGRSVNVEDDMLYWALVFFIIAIIAALFGFGGLATTAASIAQILFFVFLVIFVIALVMGVAGRRRPPI
jgi:uncharacterized membrane protein YtjA (UPF0391 family)